MSMLDASSCIVVSGVAIAGAASFAEAKVADAVVVFDAVAAVAISIADGDSVALACRQIYRVLCSQSLLDLR